MVMRVLPPATGASEAKSHMPSARVRTLWLLTSMLNIGVTPPLGAMKYISLPEGAQAMLSAV